MTNQAQVLAGKRAIVTGGTRGIGFAIARTLLEAGCAVSISGRSQSNVERAITALKPQADAGSTRIVGMSMDAQNPADHVKFYEFTDDNLGEVDAVVNNAGIGVFRKTSELTLEDWRRVIDTNLNGVFYSVKEALKRFEKRGGGYLIQISSLAGKNAFAGGAAYNASKFGLEGFSEALMLDHRYDNVRVTTIMPGSVRTDFGSGSGMRASVPGQGAQGQGAQGADDWKIAPEDIGQIVLDLLRMPDRTLISRVEVRPSRPRRSA